jgi:energy-coupling factor transporter transmembrane protein EcfT
MKRLAVVFTVVTVLLLILGLADWLTNYNWSNDQDPLFGNPHILLNDGATVLVATGFLAAVTALLWALALRKDRGHQRDR